MLSPYVVIIAGASGSGKSTLAAQLKQSAGAEQTLIVSLDRYYRDQVNKSAAERAAVDYDCWDTLDGDRLVMDIQALRKGDKSVTLPKYDFSTHARLSAEEVVQPAPLIIVEGILALYDPRLRALADDSIYLDINQDLCFHRRLKRDIAERGRTPQSVKAQWAATVAPNYERLVLPTRQYAKRVITEQSEDTYRAIIDQIFLAKETRQ
jgi:uridine kinase